MDRTLLFTRRTGWLLALGLLLTACAIPVMASTGLPNNQDDLLEDLGQYSPPWFAELQDVQLIGDRAYVFGVGGLAIFDLVDPATPVELGRYEPVGHPYNRFYRGAVSGDIACGGGRGDLLTIMDISVPSLPTAVAFHGTPGQSYEGAAIQGNYIYACRHADGLEVVDITIPGGPVTAGTVTQLVNAWDVALSGNTAYVADGMGGLAVINITTPTAPVLVTSVPTSGLAADVTLAGTVVAVSVGSAGLDIFDISDPLAPVLLSNVNTSGLAITADIVGNLVYVADWDDVEVFDLTNPAVPVPAGGEDTPIRAMGLAARSDLVVVTDWSRLRTYRPGLSTRGDIAVSVDHLDFGALPVGTVADTTFTIGNTGGAPLQVTGLAEFGDSFEILTPTPFTVPVAGSVEVTIRFSHLTAGYEGTFVRIDSDDTDESQITFPLTADDNPYFLDVGNVAPEWVHLDRDGVTHKLSDYKGRLVVMSFFANW